MELSYRDKLMSKLGDPETFSQMLKKYNAITDKTLKAKTFIWMALFVLTWSDKNVVKWSDVKIQVWDYPWFKRKKSWWWMRDERFGIITEDLVDEIYGYVTPTTYKEDSIAREWTGDKTLDYDFAVTLNVNMKFISTEPKSQLFLVNDKFDIQTSIARFRVNLFWTAWTRAFILRIIDSEIPNFDDLWLPVTIKQFTQLWKWLVLVTWPTWSGKSTTLASLLQLINLSQNKNIVTLEDPVEFVYKNEKSTFSQREVHKDTKSFSSALRAALREAPDIILIWEMRDKETISMAIEAAETWHLVFWTLHTFNAAKTVDRIIQQYPENEQNQVAQQLWTALVWVVSQSLIPTRPDASGKAWVCALNEVVRFNNPAKQNVKEKKSDSIIQSVSWDPRSLTMVDHAKQLSITTDKVEPKVLLERFYQEDINIYQLYKSLLQKAGKYNEDEDPKVIEERMKSSAMAKLTKWWQSNPADNEVNVEEVKIEPKVPSTVIIS